MWSNCFGIHLSWYFQSQTVEHWLCCSHCDMRHGATVLKHKKQNDRVDNVNDLFARRGKTGCIRDTLRSLNRIRRMTRERKQQRLTPMCVVRNSSIVFLCFVLLDLLLFSRATLLQQPFRVLWTNLLPTSLRRVPSDPLIHVSQCPCEGFPHFLSSTLIICRIVHACGLPFAIALPEAIAACLLVHHHSSLFHCQCLFVQLVSHATSYGSVLRRGTRFLHGLVCFITAVGLDQPACLGYIIDLARRKANYVRSMLSAPHTSVACHRGESARSARARRVRGEVSIMTSQGRTSRPTL